MAARQREYAVGELLPGTKYTVVKMLGAGGMGVVYHVTKPPGIQGVLKLMSAELAAHAEFQQRFLDEVKVLAELEHPNLVRVTDYDFLADRTPFYVMELLHGKTVRDVLATLNGPVRPRVAYEITRQLLEALHCAHTHRPQVVHRDIKPENIFLHSPKHAEPVVKLIDFGVAALSDRQHDGQFVGTWRYAAPEQIRGERPTPATDLYAVGLVLYELLAGKGPFDTIETGALLSQAHLHQVPTLVSDLAPWVPRKIVELIASALAKDPRQRPRDAHAFAAQLYELEWADDGVAAQSDRTAEGPLSRVLSSVSKGKPSSKNLAAAKPAPDRLGDVPLIGVPPAAQHHGATIRGVGSHPENTAPSDDELLAGLVEPREHTPFAKKVLTADARAQASPAPPQVVIRPSGPDVVRVDHSPRPPTAATIDDPAQQARSQHAPPSVKRAPESDTFASNTSQAQARGVPRSSLVPLLALGGALVAIAVVSVVVLFAWRARPTTRVEPVATVTTAVAATTPPPPAPTPVPEPEGSAAVAPTAPTTSAKTKNPPAGAATRPRTGPEKKPGKTDVPSFDPSTGSAKPAPAPSSTAGYMTTF